MHDNMKINFNAVLNFFTDSEKSFPFRLGGTMWMQRRITSKES